MDFGVGEFLFGSRRQLDSWNTIGVPGLYAIGEREPPLEPLPHVPQIAYLKKFVRYAATAVCQALNRLLAYPRRALAGRFIPQRGRWNVEARDFSRGRGIDCQIEADSFFNQICGQLLGANLRPVVEVVAKH